MAMDKKNSSVGEESSEGDEQRNGGANSHKGHGRHHGSTAVFVLIDYLFLMVFFGFLCFLLLQNF